MRCAEWPTRDQCLCRIDAGIKCHLVSPPPSMLNNFFLGLLLSFRALFPGPAGIGQTSMVKVSPSWAVSGNTKLLMVPRVYGDSYGRVANRKRAVLRSHQNALQNSKPQDGNAKWRSPGVLYGCLLVIRITAGWVNA